MRYNLNPDTVRAKILTWLMPAQALLLAALHRNEWLAQWMPADSTDWAVDAWVVTLFGAAAGILAQVATMVARRLGRHFDTDGDGVVELSEIADDLEEWIA